MGCSRLWACATRALVCVGNVQSVDMVKKLAVSYSQSKGGDLF